jgi:hypothetical protein
MQQKPIKNTPTPPIMSPSQVAWWRFVQCSPTFLLGLILRLRWPHSFLIHSMVAAVATAAQQRTAAWS